MRRIITILCLILIMFLLQSTLFSFHDVTGIAPNLMLILTMSFGIMRGRREGMLTGFVCGFLYDFYAGGIIGPYMLLFMFIGYINGAFHKDFLMEDIMLPVIIIIIDEFVFSFIEYIVFFMLRNRTDIGFYFVNVIIPKVFYTAVAGAILYRVFLAINKYLKKKVKESETY